MPSLRTLANMALGYGSRAEERNGPRFRRADATLSYGAHPLQALDLHLCNGGAGPRPVLVFVHGGAWQFGDKTRRLKDLKVPFAHGEKWHFAALNFRMVPEVGLGEMACDVAAGMAALFQQADGFGIDRARIVLMGHSSGAHLAALVAGNPALLGAHGLAPQQLAGVIANDGAAYDPALPSTSSKLLARRLIDPALADEPPEAASPVWHLRQARNAPPFLILHTQRRHARMQAVALEQALAPSGASVARHSFAGLSPLAHVRLSRQFGRAGFGPTEVARSWLGQIGA